MIFRQLAQEGGKFVNPRTGRLYPQTVLLSVRGWTEPTATVRPEVNEKSNDLSGNRTRDLPACSAVPQPTAPLTCSHRATPAVYCFRQQTPQLKQINIPRPHEASALISHTSPSLTRLIRGFWRQTSHLTSNINYIRTVHTRISPTQWKAWGWLCENRNMSPFWIHNKTGCVGLILVCTLLM
jgi:hypothetical protein